MERADSCETLVNFPGGMIPHSRTKEIFRNLATRYGLDGPGIESRWGRDFPHPSRPAVGSTQPPIQWVSCLSRG